MPPLTPFPQPSRWPRLGFVALETAVLGLGFVFVRVGEERLSYSYGRLFTSAQVASLLLLLALVLTFWSRSPRLARVGLAVLLVGLLLNGLQLPSISYR